MKHVWGYSTLVFWVFFVVQPQRASAELLEFDLNAHAGYVNLEQLESADSSTLSGTALGVDARLQIWFLQGIAEYQRVLGEADLIHLGVGFRPTLELRCMRLYATSSLGLMVFAPDSRAGDDDTTRGFQARGGGGVEFLFADDWLAIGTAIEFSTHKVGDDWGTGYLFRGYLGLRI